MVIEKYIYWEVIKIILAAIVRVTICNGEFIKELTIVSNC